MAIGATTNAQVFIGGTDVSDHVKKVTVEDNRDSVDVTAMGATSKAVTKGLGDAKITIDLYQDFALTKTHTILQPLIGSAATTAVEVRPVNGARSTTNPAALMQGLLMTYTFLDVSVGDASEITAEFVNGAQAGMTYPTT